MIIMMGRALASQTLMACHTYTRLNSTTVQTNTATHISFHRSMKAFWRWSSKTGKFGCGWESAFKRGAVSIESHPTLGQDRERHEALKIAIGDRLRVDRVHVAALSARFGNFGTISGAFLRLKF
jgi:aromatic ring-cleaving dioxygenase